jgi:tetratricopeptide (TPR) repeat protein
MDEKRESKNEQEAAPASSAMPSVRLEEVLMRQALEHMGKQEYEAAAGIYNDILKRFAISLVDVQKCMINSELGTIYFWLGDYESAKRHLEASLAYGDRNDQAYNILGKLAVAQFQFPKARGYFSKISADNPARPLGLCLVSIKLRDTKGTEAYLREAQGKLPSTDPEMRIYRAYHVLLKGDAHAATNEVRSVEKKCEKDPALMLLIAEIFMTAGSYGEANATARKVERFCPDNDGIFAVLAHSFYAQEEYDSAGDAARHAIELNPLNAYAKTVLMKLATRDGSYSIAEGIGMQILADCPEYSLAHANLGDVYFNQGRYEVAGVEYEQTEQLMDAETKGTRLRKARMQFIKEDFKSAANILEELVESAHIYYDDAMCDLLLCYDKLSEEEKKDDLMEKMQIRRSFYHRTEEILHNFDL